MRQVSGYYKKDGTFVRSHTRKYPRFPIHYGVYIEYPPKEKAVSSALPTIEDVKKFMKKIDVTEDIKAVKAYPVIAKGAWASDYKKRGRAILIKTKGQKIRKVKK